LWISTFPHAFVLEATDARDTAVAEAGRPSIRVSWWSARITTQQVMRIERGAPSP